MSTNNWQHTFRTPPLRNTSAMDGGEEEALRIFCTRMVLSVRSKLSNSSPRREGEQHVEPRDEASGPPVPGPVPRPDAPERTEGDRIRFGKHVVRVGGMASDHRRDRVPLSGQPNKRGRCAGKKTVDLTSHNLTSQGPADQLVPARLVSLLRRKTLMQEMRRALEVDPHCPSLCAACEEARASLALDAFIRRKKTQLDSEGRESLLYTTVSITH